MNIEQIKQMAHSPLHNYAIPGLTSWIIGANPDPARGGVRLFECSRAHHEPIIPHSHRFDFQCVVLAGEVTNVVWHRVCDEDIDLDDDTYVISTLHYNGEPGTYTPGKHRVTGFFRPRRHHYAEGDEYSMKHDEIHSIYFSKGSAVLFFEGPRITGSTQILEPLVDGVRVPTFKVEPWMFRKGD